MAECWEAVKLKLRLGQVAASNQEYALAEQFFHDARKTIAESDGIDSARWGVVTLDLATCAVHQKNYAVAVRIGRNAMRALDASRAEDTRLSEADSALVVGEALREMEEFDDAIRYFEFASTAVRGSDDAVGAASHADARLALLYSEAGEDTAATEAVFRVWATVDDERSWVRGTERAFAKWMIRLLQRQGRFLDAVPVWDWLAARRLADEDWYDLHTFIGRMGAAGLEEEAKHLFMRLEEMEEQAARETAE